LSLANISSAWRDYQYRCLVDGTNTNPKTLHFTNSWTGSISAAWETAGNWSCGVVPDTNTDVYLNAGTVILNSNSTIKHLNIGSNVKFTVNNQFKLSVTQ